MPFRLFLLFSLFILSIPSSAQMYFDQGRQISGTDSVAFANANALSVNPAYLGHVRRNNFDLRFLQFGYGAHSDVLDRLYVNRLTFSDGDITEDDKEEILSLAPETLDFDARTSVDWLGVSYNKTSWGGFSIDVKEEFNGTLFMDRALTQFFLDGLEAEWLQGTEDSVVMLPASTEGSEMYYEHLRKLQFGYGRKLFSAEGIHLYGGLEVSRIWGVGYLDVSFRKNLFEGQSSFSRFYDIDYGNLMAFDEVSKKLLNTAAEGWSTSFGLSADVGDRWNVGVSLLDVGELEWKYRTSAAESNVIEIATNAEDGVESFDFDLETDYLYDVFGFSPSESFTTTLDTRWRFNVLGRVRRDLSVSADVVLPTNDGIDKSKTSILLGLNYAPRIFGIAGLYINGGVLYHEVYGWRLPFGLAGELFGRAQISISTNDLITFLSRETNPLSSLSVATLGVQF